MRCQSRTEQLASNLSSVQPYVRPERYLDCCQALNEAKGGFEGSPGEIFWQDSSKAANKSVLKVDVNCTPISALDELLKQLDGPCIPTFKLKDLASSLLFFLNPSGLVYLLRPF